MNGYSKREIRPRPISAGTVSGGKRAAATQAITPNPSKKRMSRTVTTKYSPNAFHLNPLVSFQERPTPSDPPGSGSSTAACTATHRPQATTIPGMMRRRHARTVRMPEAKPALKLRPIFDRAKSSASPIEGSWPRYACDTTRMPAPRAPTVPQFARRLAIETPEHLVLELELAGVGSRIAAAACDAVLLAVLYVGLGLALVALSTGRESPGPWSTLVAVLAVLALFLLFWCYFLLFEALNHGRTPGKRLMGIRVVMDTGHPITFAAAAVRNRS